MKLDILSRKNVVLSDEESAFEQEISDNVLARLNNGEAGCTFLLENEARFSIDESLEKTSMQIHGMIYSCEQDEK